MSVRFLLDTDVLSEPPKPKPNADVLARFRAHRHEVATASVVWHEMAFGIGRLPASRRKALLEQYLNEALGPAFPVLSYDRAAALWQATERVRLAGEGGVGPVIDSQIAAVAATNDLILVTHNIRHFRRFNGLRVEDWFVAPA